MATLDEVISQMSEEDYFSDPIQFIIDSDLRIVSVPDRGVVAGVVGDKNVNRINFQMPRYYNGFDMSEFKTRINYVNANGNPNYYTVTDSIVKDDVVIFSWLVDADVVAYVGKIAFSVNMVLTGDDGVIKHAFNTSNVEKLKALEGIQIDKYISYEEQVDLISKLEADLTKYIRSGINQIQDEGAKVKKSLPADYVKMTEDVTSLKEDLTDFPLKAIDPKRVHLTSYDVIITNGKYLTGHNTSSHIPTLTQGSNFNYDVIDIAISPNNTIITVPYDNSQNVGQAFVLYTEGVQSNNATPEHVNNSQIGVIKVGSGYYTVNLNASKLNYKRVAFTVPKGRRDFYFENADSGKVGELIDSKINDFKIELLASVNMFYSIGAIGDSYTAGSTQNTKGEWHDVTDLSWIATMAKRAGLQYYSNYGRGGATTRSYVVDVLPNVISSAAKDLYFIAFGINDCLQSIPVGTISDIKEDYTQNADTFYGNYGKIIDQVKTKSPIAKIVLVKIWTSGDKKIPYDTAIEKIAQHYEIPCINPFDDIYFNSDVYLNNMSGGHPTAMGYSMMGLAMERLFSKCVVDNYEYFKYSIIG